MVKKSGYVLLLTLMILSISIVLITRLVTPVVARYQQSNIFIRQEKARQLALSGVQLVLSYLNEPLLEEKKKKDSKTSENKIGENKTAEKKNSLFTHIFEILNRWQTISLQEKQEGIEGNIELYVSNEAGKININTLYDFEKKEWKKQGPFDARKVVQWLSDRLKDQLEGINLAEILDNFFKKRTAPLDEVTELIHNKELYAFGPRLFVEKSSAQEKAVFLTDIFTVSTTNPALQPLQLSASLAHLLELSPLIKVVDEKEIDALVKQIRPNMNWPTEWNKILTPRVGKSYAELPAQMRDLFSSVFEAQTFSVLSYGNVDAVTQKVYALIEKNTVAEQEVFVIKKIYWL